MKKKLKKLKKIMIGVGCVCTICCIAFLVIHRRVIWALITGGEMPEPPAWHKCHVKNDVEA